MCLCCWSKLVGPGDLKEVKKPCNKLENEDEAITACLY
jgi:hypothetical protein